MPYEFDFERTRRILRCRFQGEVNEEEFLKYYEELARHSRELTPAAGVADFSNAQPVRISRNLLQRVANEEPALHGMKAIRITIAPSPAVFGLARMFEIMGEHTRPNFHVVRTESEAWAILGVWNLKFEKMPEKGG